LKRRLHYFRTRSIRVEDIEQPVAIMALNIMNNALNQFGARHYFHTFTRKTPGILRPSLLFVKGLNRAATVKSWISGLFLSATQL
jgi:hypothetical protein